MKDLKIEISIPKEAIEEVLITAMEGGSNYWYALNGDESRCSTWLDSQIAKGNLERDKSVHYKWMDAIFQGCPHEISVYDVEELYEDDDAECIGKLSMKSIAKGIALANKDYPKHFSNHFPEYDNGDGHSADVIFQLIVLGEVEYG